MDLEYLEALMGEAIEAIGYRDIWVAAEVEDGALTAVSLEMVGKARELANVLGAYVRAVLIGSGVEGLAQELVSHGADSAHLADNPALGEYHLETYIKVLGDLFEERRPEIVIFGATDMGEELAPQLAQRMGAGLITGCVDLEIDESQRVLVATHPVYDGEYFHVDSFFGAKPQMVTVRPGAFPIPFADESRSEGVEFISVELEGVEPRLRVVRGISKEVRDVPLAKAKVVVSGGRGMGDREGFALLEGLAEALGGVVAGSRGAVDEGWIGEERQVGMGGAIVKPDLYIACGISGAIQHYIGMQDAKFVVAINRDPNASIFKVADIGVVGDARGVIPALIKALQEGWRKRIS